MTGKPDEVIAMCVIDDEVGSDEVCVMVALCLVALFCGRSKLL